MNYEEKIKALVAHAADRHKDDAKKRAEELNQLVRALGTWIAAIAVGIPREFQRSFVGHTCAAIIHEVDFYNELGRETDYTEFLRDHFNPGKFHA